MASQPLVIAVCRSSSHTFSKQPQEQVRLLTGLGIEGDAHAGVTVKHRSRVAKNPTQPNLRQVHLIHAELHEELRALGFNLQPGDMGENVTTRGVELLKLPQGTRLRLGPEALVEITGLRNPCSQLDGLKPGLMAAVLERHGERLVRKAGVMAVVVAGGVVEPGAAIHIELPPAPHLALECV